MAELDPVEGGDVFYTIDADGSFAQGGRVAAISGSEKSARAMTAKLGEVDGALPLQEALGAALQVWGLGRLVLDSEEGQEPSESDVREFLKDGLQGLKVEAAVLDRERSVKSKFNLLTEDELPLAAYIGA
jgi:hypothetical protein